MKNRFSMKHALGFSALTVLIGMTGVAQGARELELSDVPLFLGDAVVPNVYIEMDDSGSMDWEILTKKYYYYRTYWDDVTYSGSLVDSGLWNVHSTTGTCSSRQNNTYIYRNADDLYKDCSFYGVYIYDHPQALARDWRVRSAAFNVMYYDPAVAYFPWLGATELPDADFTNARSNPIEGEAGYTDTRDLTGFIYEVWNDSHGFDGTRPRGPATANEIPNRWVDLWDEHTRYTVNADSITVERYRSNFDTATGECELTDAEADLPYETCFGATRVVSSITDPGVIAATKQNIANWYQYNRRRSFVAKGAVGAVLRELPDFRYGLSVLNEYSRLTVDVPTADVLDFTEHNEALVDDLYSFDWESNGTPLRRGLQRVGNYYKETGSTAPIIHACQQNFTVLFTDGYWNGGAPSLVPTDADGDGVNNTLADVARAYYTMDLRDDLPDRVPVSAKDTATNQHMVTFTVAFGIEGNLKDTDGDGDPDQEADGSTFLPAPDADWGNASSDPEKVDDLWHAAFNSSGSFVAADTPAEVVTALVAALRDIERRSGSAASVALNSGSLGSDTHIYQAKFESSSWSGQLLAFVIEADGSVSREPVWDAGEKIDHQTHGEREIITYDPDAGNGIRFRHVAGASDNPLNASQETALMSGAPDVLPGTRDEYLENLVNFLRGDRTHEGDGDTGGYRFRDRASKLGDVVHSDPVYVGPPSHRYPDLWRDNLYPTVDQPESGTDNEYSAFREARRTRTPMIYFGANDGMLHGINATDADAAGDDTLFTDGGAELLAYVPSMLFGKLSQLADRNYIHKYYVDGGPTAVDAFIGSEADGAWRTVLVGGLAGGGQGIYALDVTNPAHSSTGFAEANASNLVMWEFSDADDADLGYSYSRPAVVRLHNGQWAAVFGNGYNNTEADGHASTTGNAVLYIVSLADGSVLKKIDTGIGFADDPVGSDRTNGLATVAPVDLDGDGIVDYIYAGDLFGNLWKFDVTGHLATSWGVAEFEDTSKPLFQATITMGTELVHQPITSRPEVGRAPHGKPGVMVYFGTGKYLELADNTPLGQATQTFYGIWDNWASVERSELQQQEIILEQVQTFTDGDIPTLYDSPDPDSRTAFSDPESLFTADGDRIGDTSIYLEDGTEVLSLDTLRGEFDVRTSTDNGVDWETQKGWYMNLIVKDSTDNQGERQVSPSVLRNDRIIFATLLPSNDPCEYGGDSWLMELDAFSGARLPYSPFDFNLDGVFDTEDYAEYTDEHGEPVAVPASGKKSKVGIIPTPAILSGGGGYGIGSGGDGGGEKVNPCQPGAECKLASGSTGKHEETRENPGKGDYGRQSWREL